MPTSLSVLEQVAVFDGSHAAAAATETVALALAVERLGYQRFWVAEHHQDPSRGCAAPEVLATYIAARTSTIRLGPGCVLLPQTSPQRVHEQYSLLAALAPGRVDVGLGRGGPPSDAGVPFPEQVAQFLALVEPAREDHMPPQPWLMGSGERGALTAAYLGLPFAFAQFAHARLRPEITDLYRREYRPTVRCPVPTLAVAVRVSCSDSGIEAARLALAVWMPALRSPTWRTQQWAVRQVYPADADLSLVRVTPTERETIEGNPYLTLTGDAGQVLADLDVIAAAYDADELVVTTTCPTYPQRLRTFELLGGSTAPERKPSMSDRSQDQARRIT